MIKFKLLRKGAVLPTRGTAHAGAFDLFAPEGGNIWPGEIQKIGLGIAHDVPDEHPFEVPDSRTVVGLNCEQPMRLQGLLFGRSGLATKNRIRCFYSPCLIDADYRGELFITLENCGHQAWHYHQGDRIGQIMYIPAWFGDIAQTFELTETARGDGGHGSTGR